MSNSFDVSASVDSIPLAGGPLTPDAAFESEKCLFNM